MMTDDELCKDLAELYKEPDKGFDVSDYISRYGSVLQALMYSRLFWPDFIEVAGVVVRKEALADDPLMARLEKAIRERPHDLSGVEEDFNLVEIPSDIIGR